MIADNVKCNNCNEEMYVVVGTEVCPKCKQRGMLSWVDENKQEIDVSESEIANLNDYENVVNETENSIN
jgi:Archaea-specific RecJ-like exonuclease, contains DnaJ-type Zn finger domain